MIRLCRFEGRPRRLPFIPSAETGIEAPGRQWGNDKGLELHRVFRPSGPSWRVVTYCAVGYHMDIRHG